MLLKEPAGRKVLMREVPMRATGCGRPLPNIVSLATYWGVVAILYERFAIKTQCDDGGSGVESLVIGWHCRSADVPAPRRPDGVP